MRQLNNISRVLGLVGIIALLFMVVYIAIAIVLRWVEGRDILPIVNVSEYLMIIVVYFGLAWTQVKRGHVSVGVIIERLSDDWRCVVELVIALISLSFAGLLLWASWSAAMAGYQIRETAFAAGILFPMWPFRYLLPVGIGLWGCVLVSELIISLIQLRRIAQVKVGQWKNL